MATINAETLSGQPEQAKTCFVASPIGSADSPERKRSDDVLRHVISEVLEPMGYTINRADRLAQSGSITTQILTHLLTSDLAIFDLTGNNANVFYELAIRHAANKPFIQMNDGGHIPFDVSPFRTIPLITSDMSSVAQAKSDLRDMTRFYEDGGAVETPLTTVTGPRPVLAADNPLNRELAGISGGVQLLVEQMLGPGARGMSITDAGVLQRFITAYAKLGEIPLANRNVLENAMYTDEMKEWVRGLPTEKVTDETS